MVTSSISPAQVESAVHRYWKILMEKSTGELGQLYRYDSLVFNPFAQRPESGPVSAARKEREYFTDATKFRAEVGTITVQLLADNIAVATYSFRWHASRMEAKALGKTFDKAVREGRGTQVFVLTPEGELKVVHEHLSDIWRDEGK